MAVTFLESGTDATQGTEFWTVVSGLVASDTANKNTGPRSIKFTSGAAGEVAYTNKAAVFTSAGGRLSCYVRFNSLPTGGLEFLEIQQASNGAKQLRLRVTSAGVLNLQDSASAQIGSNGSTLIAGTWYRLCLTYTYADPLTSATVFLNGVQDISGTSSIAGQSFIDLRIGWQTAAVGNNLILNIDDIYVDDATNLQDTGDIHVTNKRPNANGTTNGFTTQIGGGGSGYGTGHSPQVNEQPLSTTNGWSMIGAGSAVTEEYTIEAGGTGDVDIGNGTLSDYMGWLYAKSLASETAQIVVGGATSSISLTSTNTLFAKAAGSIFYPTGGTDIGIVTATDLTTVSLYECGVLLAYIPPPPPSSANEGLPYGSLTTTYFHPGKAIRRWWQDMEQLWNLIGRPICS